MNKNKSSNVGLWLSGIYAGLFISLLIFFYVLSPSKSEFAGVYFGLLTLPWSIALVILTLVLDSSGHPDAIPFSVNLLLLAMFAAINSRWLYKLGAGTNKNKKLNKTIQTKS